MSKICALLLVLLLVGCASTNPNDPYEGYNRAMYGFNSKLDRNVFKPVAEGYRYVTPSPARTAIGNFFDNFRDVYSLGNNILSVKPEASMNDLMRVAINTTFGIGGMIDVASMAGLKNNKNTFGDTLANWGWEKSNYLVLPLLGPSTVRDSIGTVVGLAASPDGAIYANTTQAVIGKTVSIISTRSRLLGIDDSLQDAALDEYSYMRDGFMQLRAKQLGLATSMDGVGNGEDVDIDQLVAPDSDAAPVGEPEKSPEKDKLPSSEPEPAPQPIQHTDGSNQESGSVSEDIPAVDGVAE